MPPPRAWPDSWRTQIPQAQVQPMPDPPPIDRPLNGATVALMIGRDIAGRPLADLAAG